MFLCIYFIFFLFPHLAQYGYSPMAGYPSNIDTMVENERNQYETPRSFDCDTCGRSFSHKRSLKRHKWQCEKTRELVCPVCNMVYYRTDTFKNHVSLHKITNS